MSLPRTFSPLRNPYRKPTRLTFAVAAAAAGVGVLTGIGVAAPSGGPSGLALAATTQHVRVLGSARIPDHAAGVPGPATGPGSGPGRLSLLADGLTAARGSAARHGSAGPAAGPEQPAGQARAGQQTAAHQTAAHKSAPGRQGGHKPAGGHHGGHNGHRHHGNNGHRHHRHHNRCHSSQLHWWICHAEVVMRRNGTPASKLDTGAAFIVVAHESGGDPGAYNGWDSNAAAGTPSEGIAQVIQPTFKAYHLRGFGDIWNPVDNMIAAFRYAIARYGSMSNIPGVVAVRSGGAYMGY